MGEVVKRSNIDNDKEIQFSNLSETLKHVVNGKTILEHLNKYFNDIFH